MEPTAAPPLQPLAAPVYLRPIASLELTPEKERVPLKNKKFQPTALKSKAHQVSGL